MKFKKRFVGEIQNRKLLNLVPHRGPPNGAPTSGGSLCRKKGEKKKENGRKMGAGRTKKAPIRKKWARSKKKGRPIGAPKKTSIRKKWARSTKSQTSFTKA